jgi:stage III sporulation protein AH
VRRSAAPAPAGEKTAAAPLPPPEREEAKPDDFFVEYRIEREQARGRRVELLRGIMADPNAGAEAKRTAQEQLLAIAREMDTEVRLENLLRAKGFADAVVIAEEDRITVVVPGEITPEQNASIITLVGRGADVLPENVMVIAHEG